MAANSAAFYKDRGEISGIRQILLVELKKGGFKLSQKELDQARDYSKELCKAADVREDAKIVAYVLGADGEEGLEQATYGNRITIVPMLYRTLLDRVWLTRWMNNWKKSFHRPNKRNLSL